MSAKPQTLIGLMDDELRPLLDFEDLNTDGSFGAVVVGGTLRLCWTDEELYAPELSRAVARICRIARELGRDMRQREDENMSDLRRWLDQQRGRA